MPLNPYILLRRRNRWTAPQIMELWDAGGQCVDIRTTGAVMGNGTDNATALNAAITQAVGQGNCGQVFIPPGVCRVNSAPSIPDDGNVTKHRGLRIFGSGSGFDGGNFPRGGSVLLLNYDPGNPLVAQLDLRKNGHLEIDRLWIQNLANTTSPVVKDRGTVLALHDCTLSGWQGLAGNATVQSAVVMGGGNSTQGLEDDSSFSGYGSYLDNLMVVHANNVVRAGADCNGLPVWRVYAWSHCGGNRDFGNAPFVAHGGNSGTGSIGNSWIHCLAETIHYKHAYNFHNSHSQCVVASQNFDNVADYVSDFYLGANNTSATIFMGATLAAPPVQDGNVSNGQSLWLTAKPDQVCRIPTPIHMQSAVAVGGNTPTFAGTFTVTAYKGTNSSTPLVVIDALQNAQAGAWLTCRGNQGETRIKMKYFGGQNTPTVQVSGNFPRVFTVTDDAETLKSSLLARTDGSPYLTFGVASGLVKFNDAAAADGTDTLWHWTGEATTVIGRNAGSGNNAVGQLTLYGFNASLPILAEVGHPSQSGPALSYRNSPGFPLTTISAEGFLGIGNRCHGPVVPLAVNGNGVAANDTAVWVDGTIRALGAFETGTGQFRYDGPPAVTGDTGDDLAALQAVVVSLLGALSEPTAGLIDDQTT